MTATESFVCLLDRQFCQIARLTAGQLSALEGHYALLTRWNRTLNLTAIRGLEEAVVRHYCESLFLAAQLPPGQLSVLDVGSGAGFPGIPLAVLRPDCRVVLAESQKRKAVFLAEATRGWPNVKVLPQRAEELETDFDWVVSRAVRGAEVAKLTRGSLGLLLSRADAAELSRLPGFVWREPIALPWDGSGVVLFGSRVPRGTSE